MKTIYKYAISHTEKQEYEMPAGATLLAVQMQYGQPCVWAEVDDAAPRVRRTLAIVGTGQEVPSAGVYIGSFQIEVVVGIVNNVWHIYDLGEVQP